MNDEHGPLMAALEERQRNFIKAMLANPWGRQGDWAKAAGYSDHLGAERVRGHHLANNPRIMAAAREYAAGHFLDGTGVTMAISVLIAELSNKDARIRLHAANSILDRGGVSAKTEHRVVVSHSAEDMEKIALRLATELGIEPMKLIGGNTIDVDKAQLHGTRTNQAIFEGKLVAKIPVVPERSDASVFCPDHPDCPCGEAKHVTCRFVPQEGDKPAEPGDVAERKNEDKMDIDNDIAF